MKTITITLTFDPSNCVDVDADSYDVMADVESVMGFALDHYNLTDWVVVDDAMS